MTEKFMDIDKFIPVLDRIIIQEVSREELLGIDETEKGEKKQGMLYVKDNSKDFIDRISYGKVLKIGDDVNKYKLNEGDIIAYQSYPNKFGVPLDMGNINAKEKYRMLTQVDILAIIGE